MTSGFDRLASPYRWMEYLTFGRALERCRYHFLPDLPRVRNALVLGDGDGRFAARLLETQDVRLCAVDCSEAMLRALRERCRAHGEQIETIQANLSEGLPPVLQGRSFDLVATHFFLDCLRSCEVEKLAGQLVGTMRPDALWLVSEFDVPAGAWRLPGRALVRALYAGFRLAAGLRTQRLPDWRGAMGAQGLRCRSKKSFLAGLLVAEVWVLADVNSSSGNDWKSRIVSDDESLPPETCIGRYAEK